MLGYLSADIICSEKLTVLQERSSRKTVSSKELLMSKGKYPTYFKSQMEAIVFIILQMFFRNTHSENITGYSPVLAGEYIQSHDVFLLCVSEKYLMDYT